LGNVIAGSVFPAEQEQNSDDRIYFGLADLGERRVRSTRATRQGRREAALRHWRIRASSMLALRLETTFDTFRKRPLSPKRRYVVL